VYDQAALSAYTTRLDRHGLETIRHNTMNPSAVKPKGNSCLTKADGDGRYDFEIRSRCQVSMSAIINSDEENKCIDLSRGILRRPRRDVLEEREDGYTQATIVSVPCQTSTSRSRQ